MAGYVSWHSCLRPQMGHCEKCLDTPLPADIGAVRLSREAKVSLIEATASSFAESFTERTVLKHGMV